MILALLDFANMTCVYSRLLVFSVCFNALCLKSLGRIQFSHYVVAVS